jgi:hypothetical protein
MDGDEEIGQLDAAQEVILSSGRRATSGLHRSAGCPSDAPKAL